MVSMYRQSLFHSNSHLTKTLCVMCHACPLNARQSTCLLPYLRQVQRIPWRDREPDMDGLRRTGMRSMFSLRRQRDSRWLDHIRQMFTGCFPTDFHVVAVLLSRDLSAIGSSLKPLRPQHTLPILRPFVDQREAIADEIDT